METKHTPGPWIMKECPCGHEACTDYIVSVTRCDGRLSKADAKLIAAAPDLLEALIAAKKHLDWIGYGDSYERECAGTLESDIEEAIKKATE